MGKIVERCAGIDVGKRFLLCCVLTGLAAEEHTVRLGALILLSRIWNDCEPGSKRSRLLTS